MRMMKKMTIRMRMNFRMVKDKDDKKKDDKR